MEIQKDKGKRVEHKLVQWTIGFSLPSSGGMLDQPSWMVFMFENFMSGERAAAMKELKK